MSSYSFRLNWRVTLFACVCLPVFVYLGFWQLDREEEKRELLAQLALRAEQPGVPLSMLAIEDDLSGWPVILDGRFDEEVILLLDNRVLDGKVGFEAHQLFHDESGTKVLVNRGFVQMGRTRADKLDIPSVSFQRILLKGTVYKPSEQSYVLTNEEASFAGFPAIVQQIDIVQFGKAMGYSVYPYTVRLEQDQAGALPRYWPSSVMQPEQHMGYAVQWFAMAIAVFIAWLFFSVRRKEEL